ncbi:OLC1v1013169C1 [Oldenlandia corymbosa var. corymbosa]|uniref:Pectinesterase n=1 Tax=Oldenlandia corymbosa var. corymbosa TaxID=529605 RepID=A0AAV1E196_OLDCO|nr:OLC1v1013169C1 [Oldenlandia corymbosa var. corymbosa]
MEAMTFLILLIIMPLIVVAADNVPAPADLAQVETWFAQNVQPFAYRKGLDPALVTAESGTPTIINVRAAGGGDFRTLTEAVDNIPEGNTNRVVINIGPGSYFEKVTIPRSKPFVTLYGAPENMPAVLANNTAAVLGTIETATVIVESDYFMAVNVIFANKAPRPYKGEKGGQALALRISGDKAAFYNCRFLGFQDTICDHQGLHFFKDCYVEGTVDFIFGNGKSIYLNVETHVIPGDNFAVITAQGRNNSGDDTGYSFIHGNVTGAGKTTFLGRSWMPYAATVFSYTDMSDVVHPQGWFDNFHPETEKTVYFGEFNCIGVGAKLDDRVGFSKKLSEPEATPFLTLGYINASIWLLPPPSL